MRPRGQQFLHDLKRSFRACRLQPRDQCKTFSPLEERPAALRAFSCLQAGDVIEGVLTHTGGKPSSSQSLGRF